MEATAPGAATISAIVAEVTAKAGHPVEILGRTMRVALFLLRDAPLLLFANGPTAMAVFPMRKRRSLILLKTFLTSSRLLPTVLTLMKTNSMRMRKRRRRLSMLPWTVWPRPKAVSSIPYEKYFFRHDYIERVVLP